MKLLIAGLTASVAFVGTLIITLNVVAHRMDGGSIVGVPRSAQNFHSSFVFEGIAISAAILFIPIMIGLYCSSEWE